MISRTAEENGMEVFWRPLKFIANYTACRVSRVRDLDATSSRDLLFADTFSTSPGVISSSTSPLARLFSRKFRFLAGSTDLCIASPAIRRANKYGRDNILIDL